ncbi:glycine zipper domain-containing protein [Desulfocastanea catecholica]
MKPVNMTVAMIALFALSLTNVQAGDKQVGGLILGGGTGAIVGQAVGRNAESTIVGATVGGVVGLLVGTQLERQHGAMPQHSQVLVHSQVYDNHRYNNYRYDNYRYDNHRYDRRVRPVFRDPPRKHYRYDRDNCRKVVTIQKGHYGSKRVVSTVCGKSPRYQQPERHPFNNKYRSNDRFNDRFHR